VIEIDTLLLPSTVCIRSGKAQVTRGEFVSAAIDGMHAAEAWIARMREAVEVMISRRHFEDRLIAIFLSGPQVGMPRREEDRRVLLTTVCLGLDRRRAYSEREINQLLADWPARMGGRVRLDHVTLRRSRVDGGFLLRDAAGHQYRVAGSILQGACDPAVLDINPVECLQVEVERRLMKKAQQLEKEQRQADDDQS